MDISHSRWFPVLHGFLYKRHAGHRAIGDYRTEIDEALFTTQTRSTESLSAIQHLHCQCLFVGCHKVHRTREISAPNLLAEEKG